MKLITYRISESSPDCAGVLHNGRVYPLSQFSPDFLDMNDFISGSNEVMMDMIRTAVDNNQADSIPEYDIIKRPPIPFPKQDIICLGINYMDHAEEAARFENDAFGGKRPAAIYFSKRVNEAVGDGGFIPSHKDIVDSLDYEAELGVIISRDIKDISKEDVRECIFGYTIINDVSARNIQTRHKQWYFGKSLDGFSPMGPCIVTADEIPFPPQLNIKSRVNGEARQNSNTSLLIFDIAHIISELSHDMTLRAGTIISTGTPAGVGMGFDPPRFLSEGDVIECEIEQIGILRNTVR